VTSAQNDFDDGGVYRLCERTLTFIGEDSPMSNLLLSVMRAFAQFERELIRERQCEGNASAKREGK
jgi:DNA invertase Pin-like site-specific DNA recombinase